MILNQFLFFHLSHKTHLTFKPEIATLCALPLDIAFISGILLLSLSMSTSSAKSIFRFNNSHMRCHVNSTYGSEPGLHSLFLCKAALSFLDLFHISRYSSSENSPNKKCLRHLTWEILISQSLGSRINTGFIYPSSSALGLVPSTVYHVLSCAILSFLPDLQGFLLFYSCYLLLSCFITLEVNGVRFGVQLSNSHF